MHRPAALRAALASLPPRAEYRRLLYRTIRPGFLAPTPLAGIGARLYGSRFSPKGSFDTIYLAEDPLTAFSEFQYPALDLIRRLDDEHAVRLPVLATLTPHAALDPGRVIDLTRREVRRAPGTDLNEITGPWRGIPGRRLPPTQVLGREVYNSGRFLAIRYPSARHPGGVCLAVFEDRLRASTGGDFLDLDDSANGGPVQRIP
ncbi:MAG: RES family NAD+ phosphorylase [Gemmataceae bacterium]|nr:RES family NAD+ phosphorylase [Gemmataceae bacterium]